MQFLKKHYEKIILCVVLLGLAAAAIWMGAIIAKVQEEVNKPIPGPPAKAKLLAPLDLTTDLLALAQVTNPPTVVLSGEHNLFNPVTWRKKPNGELLKILKTGPDALSVVNITPLYTVITYDHASGEGAYIDVQRHSGKKAREYAKKDEKTKSGLYILRGTEGATDDPTALKLEILESGQVVSVAKGDSYKQVDGYIADMKYDPESRNLTKQHVGDLFTLDGEQYKIVEITNNLVRVLDISTTKVTPIIWNGNP